MLALPAILTGAPRVARGAAPPPRRARRVLIINLSGGVRSSAAFLASGSKALNPWGRLDKGVPFPLGRLLDDHLVNQPPAPRELYALRDGGFGANARLTPFRDLATPNGFSVVGTWDPSRGDHERSQRVMATGSTSNEAPGLVVKLFAALSMQNKKSATADAAEPTPPFVVGADAKAFATARGNFARFAAVDIVDPSRLPSANDKKWDSVAERVGNDFVPPPSPSGSGSAGSTPELLSPRTGAAGRELVDLYALHHRTSRRLGALLGSPTLAITRDTGETTALGSVRVASGGKTNSPTPREVPLTNEMIREVISVPQRLGGGGGGGTNGMQQTDPSASFGLAMRLLQIGSPAVAIDLPGFDSHSGERTVAPRLYRELGGLLSALHFLLARTVDPVEPSVSMLDRTLVITTSEFGRDPGLASTGFNGGEGSDHGSHPACFYVAHAIMGAGVIGGRLVGGVSTESYDARREPIRYSPQRLLATAAYALGIDVSTDTFGFEGAAPIEELWKA